MKKGVIRNIGLLLLILILSIGVTQLYEGLIRSPIEGEGVEKLSHYGVHYYKIDAKFVEEQKLLKVTQQVEFNNVYKEDFKRIYFHLYPNAFKEKESTPFPESEMERAYPKGFQTGYIDIKKVFTEDKEIEYSIGGQQNTILTIEFNKPLKQMEKILLTFEFDVKIPPLHSRLGYGDNTFNFGNCYPIAAVYDDKGWNLDPYYDIGDPFYSEVSNYEVTLRVPKNYELASTGNVLKTKIEKDKEEIKIWKVKAEGVRDFTWVLSDKFKIVSERKNGIDINVYYLKGQKGNKALEVAKSAIEIFSDFFGEYPYEQFSVVSCDFYIGGMEYPNLVYIDQNIFSRDSSFILEYIIAHEAAHQWWYGIVGNDQVNEPWVDEALTEYSTILYYRERYGEETMMSILKRMVVDDYVRAKNQIQGKDESIARGVDEFRDSSEYSGLVYSKGAMMFYELEREVGRGNFKNILRYYMQENKFSNVTGQNIKNVTKAVTGKDYKEFFDKWLEK